MRLNIVLNVPSVFGVLDVPGVPLVSVVPYVPLTVSEGGVSPYAAKPGRLGIGFWTNA